MGEERRAGERRAKETRAPHEQEQQQEQSKHGEPVSMACSRHYSHVCCLAPPSPLPLASRSSTADDSRSLKVSTVGLEERGPHAEPCEEAIRTPRTGEPIRDARRKVPTVLHGPARSQALVAVGLVLQVVAQPGAAPTRDDVSKPLSKAVTHDDKRQRGTRPEKCRHQARKELVAAEAEESEQYPAQRERYGESLQQ